METCAHEPHPPPAGTARKVGGTPGVGKPLEASRLLPFVRHAVRAGWSEEALTELCARHGIDRAAFDSLTGRVPQEGAFAVVEAICAASRDDNLGLHLGREASASWMSILGVIAMNLTNVREVLEICAGYTRRFAPRDSGRFFRLDEEGRLHLFRSFATEPHGRPWPRQFIEADLAARVVLLRRFTGLEIKVLQVSFPHAAPADLTEHVAFFGTKDLRFGAPIAELLFPAFVLELRHQSPDLGLAAYMRRQVEALLEMADASSDIAGAVRQNLRDVLDRGGEASLAGTARRLKVSRRTLQRRLTEAGVPFLTLLEEIRCERAINLLRRSQVDLAEIAERVGFSDPRSLRRALKRRTGYTPSELRRDEPASHVR